MEFSNIDATVYISGICFHNHGKENHRELRKRLQWDYICLVSTA